jgi:hypothetical protein
MTNTPTTPSDPDGAATQRASELELGWIDICRTKGATVIVDYSAEWSEFLDASELHFEDVFSRDVPDLTPGLYRWSGFMPGCWDEGDLISLKGGTFTCRLSDQTTLPAALRSLPSPGDEIQKLRRALQDIAEAEPIPNDAVAFVWCRKVALAALSDGEVKA